MGNVKMEKKAQRFVHLLAKKLSNNEKEQSPASASRQDIGQIKQTFREALDNLPKGDLKTELQRNAATYARSLEKLIKETSLEKKTIIDQNSEEHVEQEKEEPGPQEATTSRPTSKMKKAANRKQRASLMEETKQIAKDTNHRRLDGTRLGDEVEDVDYARTQEQRTSGKEEHQFVYNMYADDAPSKVVDSLRKLSVKEKMRLAPHAYAALRSPSSFSEFLKTLHPNDDVPQGSIRLLKQEILAGFGVVDSKVFIRCLADCLSVIIAETDACFATTNTERLKELQDFILHILLWARIHHGNHEQENVQASSLASFDDLVAAILSIFVDVSIVLLRDVQGSREVEGRKTLSRILQVIGHSSSHQLNMLLQVTQATVQDSCFMLPICRHVMNNKPNLLTNELFIKYIYAAAFSRNVLQDYQEAVRDITHSVMTIEIPPKFFLWLYVVAPEAYSGLPDTVKCKKLSIVKYLMEEAPRDYLEKLLDILSDQDNASQDLHVSNEDSQDRVSQPNVRSPENEENATSPQGLFFTDTSGDKDLAQLVDNEDDVINSRLDAIIDEIDGFMEGLETKESSEEDDDNFSDVENPEIEEAIPSSLDEEPQPLQDSRFDSESNMDTGPSSDVDIQEIMSFEEQRYNLLKAQKTAEPRDAPVVAEKALSPASRIGEGGSKDVQVFPEKALSLALRNQETNKDALGISEKTLSPASKIEESDDDALVIPETQIFRHGINTEGGNSKQAKDESKSWIVVDGEISFTTKPFKQEIDKRKQIGAKNRGRKKVKQAFKDKSDDVIALEKDSAKDLAADGTVDPSPKRPGTKRLKKSPVAPKMQQPLSEETSQSEYGMHLRSMDHNQSSILSFFTPVRRSNKKSIKGHRPSQDKEQANDEVEVVSDSCISANENDKSKGLRSASPQKKRTLKSLSELNRGKKDSRASFLRTVDAKQLTSTPVNTYGAKKQKKLSRSAQMTRIPWEPQESSDSDAYVEASSFKRLQPVLNSSKSRMQSSKTSKLRTFSINDVVSEGIRRIRQECQVTTPELPQEPSSNSMSAKRKSLTITGGVKSKVSRTVTPVMPVARSVEHLTPADKASLNSDLKQQGVSPRSPSKLQRAPVFGNTHRTPAGISSKSQKGLESLPVSKAQEPPLPKRPKMKPKDLEASFDEDSLDSSQGRTTKKQTAVIQPVSDSSQRSTKLAKGTSINVNYSEGSSPSCKSRTPARTGSLPPRDSEASLSQSHKEGRNTSTRSPGPSSQRTSPKRKASMSRSTPKSVKRSRKSTGLNI